MLISATGWNKNNLVKGFTLIELLTVMMIIGIATTLLLLNSNIINSYEAKSNSIENTINLLSQESILTGYEIGWFVNSEENYAAYLIDKNKKEKIKNFDISLMIKNNVEKIVFIYQDGTQINLNKENNNLPILVFYPSGENSSGILEIYHKDYVEKLSILSNGELNSEHIKF
tara:strand:+ start:1488 stop:2003 length:516 start_codon:yes stop_codon:yes gene_type:complete